MNAFVLIHFGNNIKYLELELYFIIMLKKNTNNDIIYLYSLSDTPKSFIKIIKQYCDKIYGYDDSNLTYDIKNYNSYYTHFNTLRTCNFIFAYKLTNYKKICIIESDMIIMNNIDEIFNLKCPAILYYQQPINKYNENNKIVINKKDIIKECENGSPINGGLILFKPSKTKFQEYKENLKLIIENKCKYPNESLFIYTNPTFYNLPIKYNLSHYQVNNINIPEPIYIYHFNETQWKYLDIIKDNWIDKLKKEKLKKVITMFKTKYYDIYKDEINKLLLSN